MPELSFDDLIPDRKAGGDVSFDDLIPKAPGEDVTAGMALRGVPILGAYVPQAEAAIRAAVGRGSSKPSWRERYEEILPQRQADYAQAEREQPIASTALQMGGGAAALAPLGATALGARALGAAGPMAARIPLGAASGAGISAADALARGEDVGTAAGVGGAVGGALPVVGGAVRRVITPFPARDPGRAGMVAALEREGVQPTAGQQTGSKALQYTESMLGDTPLAGGQATAAGERSGQQFTRAALRRIGLQGDDITPAAVDRAVTDIENQFQRLSASTTINFDRQMANDLGAAMNRYGRKLPSQQREVVNDIVNDIVAHGRSMPGDVYQMARSDLSRMAQATRRTDPAYSDALRGLRNALDGAMQRSLTPAERAAWEQARRQWANWRTLENAVKNTDASGNVRISPAQLRQSAATRERGGFGRGLGDFNELARAGDSLLKPLPNSGTAQRLFASGLGGMVMAPAGIPAAAAGLALPVVGGRAMMSRPGQAYLRNQLLPGRGTGRTGIQAGLMGLLQGYAEGGRPPKDQPIVVGEQGPEVFVPDRDGTVIPANGPMPSRDEIQRYLRATTQDYPKFGAGGIPVNADAFTAALEGMPESSNIEDRRDELGGFAAAAARTGRRGRQEGAGTRFVEGGYGVPSLYNMLDKGAQEAFESAGSLQRGGSYDPAPVVAQALGAVGAPMVAPAMEGAVLGAGAIRRAAIPQAAKQELRAGTPLSPEMEAYLALKPGSQEWRQARHPEAKFPQYAEQYPPTAAPEWVEQTDPKKLAKGNTGWFAKVDSPEAKEFLKERQRIMKDMDTKGYDPYFDPQKRFDVDPANYPLNTDTINIVPKTLDTLSKHFNNIGSVETRKALQDAYTKGVELGGKGAEFVGPVRLTTQDWYMMGQLEQDLVRQLGEKAGREAFKEKFATAMAATTGGMNPRANLIAGGYQNYLAAKGQQWPAEANLWPSPVGARYGKELGKTAQRIQDEGGFAALGEQNPKRHNFAGDFMGHTKPGTMDEQMTALMQPGKTQPDWYGLNEHVMAQEAAKRGVDPRKFQETGWAGFKGEAGGPMIQEVNHTVERIHRLTGMPREEIIRRGWGSGDIPIYSGYAPPINLKDE